MRRGLLGFLAGLGLCASCSHPIPQTADSSDRARARIEAAELALARGDFERARRAFDGILEGSPESSRALLGSARAHLASDRGEEALARFSAYRSNGNPWNRAQQWQYCRALALATDQHLASRTAPARAFELARRLESEGCADPRSSLLILRSALALADEARRDGHDERALEAYLSLISGQTGTSAQTSVPETLIRDMAQGKSGRDLAAAARARAYLAASELFLESHRRANALEILSRGLGEFPEDRNLVKRMVAILADGSATETSEALTPAELGSPAAD